MSLLDLEHFGLTAFSEVGAFGVASIVQTHPAEAFARGDEKGFFAFGGSTIIMIFRPGSIRFDDDLVARSATEAKVFIGGRLVYSVPGLPALSEITRTLSYFGRSQYSVDPYFTGRMRNARIWGSCLTPAQVLTISL